MRGNAQRGRHALAALMIGVSLGGCGVVERVTSTPTITEVTSDPSEITFPPSPSPSSTASADPVATPVGRALPEPGPLSATERLVVVDTLGVALAGPMLFLEIDPEKYLPGSAALDELASQMGMSADQLRNGMLNQVDRLVVGQGDDGRPASIVVVRTPLDSLPTEALLRRDLGDLLGGTVSSVSRVTTPAGPAVRAVYRLGDAWGRQYGEALYLEAGDAVVSVTMTSWSAAEAKAMTARVVKTIRLVD